MIHGESYEITERVEIVGLLERKAHGTQCRVVERVQFSFDGSSLAVCSVIRLACYDL